ncbi:MAG: HU family DNA-binding protein [Actinomycetota bacterium]
MNKSSLVSEVASRTRIAPKDVATIVDSTLEVIRSSVAKGERVVLSGFGTFELVRRNPRTGRNPHTGEVVKIPARNQPSFRPGSAFRDAAAGRRRKSAKKKKTTARRRAR